MQTFRPVVRWWSLTNPRLMAHFSESLIVHADRLIFRKGIFDKREVVIPFSRITNYAGEQSFMDRIFGTGNFKIETAGSSIAPELVLIGYPYEVRNIFARALTRETTE
jgi:membrane protein YdbS with pleckstrin-like domain